MKSLLSFCILSYLILLPVFTQDITEAEAQSLLQKASGTTQFMDTDFSAQYVVVQQKPGEGVSSVDAIMYRRDKIGAYTILVTGPAADRGKGYVQLDGTIWFYDPKDRRFTFTSARDKFQNTNANTSDFAPQYYDRDYAIDSAVPVRLGVFDCVLYELTAKVDKVDYPKLRLWVSREDGLIRKKEDYSLSGTLLRTTAIPSYQKVGGRSVPVSMLIVDNLKGKKIDGKMNYERTQISISNVSFARQKDNVYTKSYVEMMSR